MAVKLLFAQIYVACVIMLGFFSLDLPHLPNTELLFRCTQWFWDADVQVTHYIS